MSIGRPDNFFTGDILPRKPRGGIWSIGGKKRKPKTRTGSRGAEAWEKGRGISISRNTEEEWGRKAVGQAAARMEGEDLLLGNTRGGQIPFEGLKWAEM